MVWALCCFVAVIQRQCIFITMFLVERLSGFGCFVMYAKFYRTQDAHLAGKTYSPFM